MLKFGRSATKIGTNVWSMEKGATPWATMGNTMEKGATPLVESNTFQVVSYILIIFMVITMATAMLILTIVISMIVKRTIAIYDRDMDAATPDGCIPQKSQPSIN